MQRNTEAAARKGIGAFRGLVEGYLCEAHLRSPESGCPVAALVASQLVGALQIARALGANARGRKHLAAAREFLLQQFDPERTRH
jgi:hypothetical protein